GRRGVAFEHLLPALPAVQRAVDAAIAAGMEKTASDGHEDAQRIRGIDGKASDTGRAFEAGELPRVAAVGRAVQATASVSQAPAARAGFAGSRVERSIRGEGQRTDGLARFVGPPDAECPSRVDALPDAAGSGRDVDGVRLLWIDSDVQYAPA